MGQGGAHRWAWPISSLETRRWTQQRGAVKSDPITLRHPPVHFARLNPVMTIQDFRHKFTLRPTALYLRAPSRQTGYGVADIRALAARAEFPKLLGRLVALILGFTKIAIKHQISNRLTCILSSPPQEGLKHSKDRFVKLLCHNDGVDDDMKSQSYGARHSR